MMDMNQGMNPYGTPMPSSNVGAGGGDFMSQLQQWFQQQGAQRGYGQAGPQQNSGPNVSDVLQVPAGQSQQFMNQFGGMPPNSALTGGGQMSNGGTTPGAGQYSTQPLSGPSSQFQPQLGGGGAQPQMSMGANGNSSPIAPGAFNPTGGGMPPGVNWSQLMQQITGGGGQSPAAPPNYSPAGGYGAMTTNMQAPQTMAMNQAQYGGGAMSAGQQPGLSGAPGFGNTAKPASFDPNAVPGGQFASSSDPLGPSGGQQASQFNPGGAQGFAGSWMNALPSASGNPSYSNKTQAF